MLFWGILLSTWFHRLHSLQYGHEDTHFWILFRLRGASCFSGSVSAGTGVALSDAIVPAYTPEEIDACEVYTFAWHVGGKIQHDSTILPKTNSKFAPENTLQGTNISSKNGILKMIFLFPRWDMLIPWRVDGCKTRFSLGLANFQGANLLG